MRRISGRKQSIYVSVENVHCLEYIDEGGVMMD